MLLRDQDRRSWDRSLIDEGQSIVRGCLRRDRPGPYQIQAAISAVYAEAMTFATTDWSRVVALYDQLIAFWPTPIVALNRAIAVGEVEGPTVALGLVDSLDLDDYYPYHAARADLLRRVGRRDEAASAYATAAALAPGEAERRFLASQQTEPPIKPGAEPTSSITARPGGSTRSCSDDDRETASRRLSPFRRAR